MPTLCLIRHSLKRTNKLQWERGAPDQALGLSRGGLATKIHMLAGALGRPLRLVITPGNRGDNKAALPLVKDQKGGSLLADAAYDANVLRDNILQNGVKPIIKPDPTRKVKVPFEN